MPIDELLRESLRREPTGLADPDAWDDVRARGARIRRRRRVAAGSLAAGAVMVLAAVVVAGAGITDGERNVVTTGGPPAQEVVAVVDGQVVVLDGADGHVLRTLTERVTEPTPTYSPGQATLIESATTVAPTPDGKTVYFQRGDQCGFRPSVWRVPMTGGTPERVAPVGQSPLISPDGRLLAYAGSSDPAPGDCGPFDQLVVRDLVSGAERRLTFTPDTGQVVVRTWSPDSARVVAFAATPDRGQIDASIDVTGADLHELQAFAEPAGNGLAFLPSGELVTAFPTDSTSRIATFDPATGEEERLVAEIETPLELVGVDATGEEFLLAGPLADSIDGKDLLRASTDEPTPAKLADRVRDAAWLYNTDDPAPSPAASVSSTEIVATVRDDSTSDRIVVIAADDGHEIRTLSEDTGRLGLGGISVSPDGQKVYFGRVRQGLPCGRMEIVGVPTNGRGPEQVVVRGSKPVLSPDGRTLAYARVPAGADPCASGGNVVVLRDLATGAEQEVDLLVQELRESVGDRGYAWPWTWSPEGDRFVVALGNGERYEPISTAGFPYDPNMFTSIPVPSPAEDATYLPDGRLVVSVPDDETGTNRLLTYDFKGRLAGTLFETDTPGMLNVSSDAAGDLLLHFGGDLLQRWRPGDDEPTTIATGVRDAAWIPR
jgi:Tol biopolymer transport system component